MVISGLQKLTLLDYPGAVACTVFLQGCNYRCPYCHNSGLLGSGSETPISEEELFAFLEGKRRLLDGVCVTGGEPTLQSGLPDFLRRIRALGLRVKLDTNGTRPDVLARLIDEGLVDTVAMDVKNCPSRWRETVGCETADLSAVEKSLRLLLGGGVSYELRTTVVSGYHDDETMEEMGRWLASICEGKKPGKLFLQYFADRDSVIERGLCPPDEGQMRAYAGILSQYVEDVAIRGA